MKHLFVPQELWLSGELLEVDRMVHAAQDEGGAFNVFAAPAIHGEVKLRYQRLTPVTNTFSAAPAFVDLLRDHRRLHDLRLPLVRADLEHAIDTWQWVLRLEPLASAEVQVAALLHDIERLTSEPRHRIEQYAPNYQTFKDNHAALGAQRAGTLLAGRPWDLQRVMALIDTHERRSEDPDALLIGDADVLSFFALNSVGYLRYYGAEVTRRKVAYSLARGTPRVRDWLPQIRMHPLVRGMVQQQFPMEDLHSGETTRFVNVRRAP